MLGIDFSQFVLEGLVRFDSFSHAGLCSGSFVDVVDEVRDRDRERRKLHGHRQNLIRWRRARQGEGEKQEKDEETSGLNNKKMRQKDQRVDCKLGCGNRFVESIKGSRR